MFHKIHMKSNEIVLFFKENWSSERSIFSFLYWRVSRIFDRLLNQRKVIPLKEKNLNLKVKWNHHTKGCSLNIMSTITVKQQNSKADILNPFYSGQIALIWKKKVFFVWLNWFRSCTKEYIRDLNDNNKYYGILCKEKSLLLYQ